MAATMPGGQPGATSWPPGWPPLRTRVYHRNRRESGIVLAEGAPDTTWVLFDWKSDAEEVSSCLLEEETTEHVAARAAARDGHGGGR